MLWIIIALLASYLIGSIPTAYIFGKCKGIDIRKVGSGNVGATNALRALGKTAGITVLIIDILKGFISVLLIGGLFSGYATVIQMQNLSIIIGLSCICGHNWTVFLNFKGGKGIATTFGVLLALAFRIPGLGLIIGLLILIWFILFLIFRIVSLASIVAAVSLPVLSVVFSLPLLVVLLCFLLCIFVLFRHKSNISRILKGSESRLKF